MRQAQFKHTALRSSTRSAWNLRKNLHWKAKKIRQYIKRITIQKVIVYYNKV